MKPIAFKEQTRTLHRPSGMSGEDCGILPIFTDGSVCISCWRMTLRERLSALLFGKVWAWVHSGSVQPPISLACYRSAFKKEEENERTDQD